MANNQRYQVGMTKEEIEAVRVSLASRAVWTPLEARLIAHLERRLRQIQSHEEMESRLSLDPEIQVGI